MFLYPHLELHTLGFYALGVGHWQLAEHFGTQHILLRKRGGEHCHRIAPSTNSRQVNIHCVGNKHLPAPERYVVDHRGVGAVILKELLDHGSQNAVAVPGHIEVARLFRIVQHLDSERCPVLKRKRTDFVQPVPHFALDRSRHFGRHPVICQRIRVVVNYGIDFPVPLEKHPQPGICFPLMYETVILEYIDIGVLFSIQTIVFRAV